ncbi:SDR family oxidoreductase [Actinocorallia sp. API 0066]|uniref:SDR family oxidoreductase n=1 Tax=Actinocorallia sp. API 0066 TaxID=2896846 RepID=UPI001E5103DE|nr:SDR family oxidoreductase [Actinocorallia sp. API 0066]MCD0452378.1 SDR family oxidoreductase [Actinocorallia sp. API 0066]
MGTYLITGATGGIGLATAELLREQGHDLVLTARSPERLTKIAARFAAAPYGKTQAWALPQGEGRPSGQPVRTVPLDLAEPRRIEAALALADLPPALDGVVHSAGVCDLGTVAELDADTWIDQLMVNLVGAAELTRLLLPSLRAAGGHVVFVNSGAGLRAHPNWSAYAASKHGLKALADSLRQEEPALRVTTVYPGRTASEMQRRVRAQESAPYDPADYIQPATVARAIVGALGTPADAVVTDLSIRPRA